MLRCAKTPSVSFADSSPKGGAKRSSEGPSASPYRRINRFTSAGKIAVDVRIADTQHLKSLRFKEFRAHLVLFRLRLFKVPAAVQLNNKPCTQAAEIRNI